MNPFRTRIKICGVCRPEDAALAARAGADAIGLIFYPAAPRFVPADRARAILAALPPFVTPVGLFVDADTDTILRTARDLGLRHVQLHGHEPAAQVGELAPLAVVKAVRVERDRFVETLAGWRESIRVLDPTNFTGFVLETAGTKEAGGTGVANDWAAVRSAMDAGAFDGLPSVIAAGGLNPETVTGVIRAIRPYAVDVSSGVEEVRGQKSEAKVKAFVDAVRAADAVPA